MIATFAYPEKVLACFDKHLNGERAEPPVERAAVHEPA
jgi:hypothetical protein